MAGGLLSRELLSLAIAMSAKYLRQVRAAVLDELSKDYVVGAEARGIHFSVTLWKSVLWGMPGDHSYLAYLVHRKSAWWNCYCRIYLFLWDGVGGGAVDAINMRDYPMIQAYVMWMAIIYVCVNLITDLSYRFLDLRIRLGGEEA